MSLYNQLKRELGEIDASAECLELAMREFIDASKLFNSPTDFIRQLSLKHGIHVDVFDLALFVQRGSALRIIGVTQAFETFLDRFIEGHPRIQTREGRRNDEALLSFVVRKLALTNNVTSEFTGALDYKLYNYYRQLRNGIAHEKLQNQRAANLGLLRELRIESVADSRYTRLAAPNSAQALTFDDYVLFTRATKSIGAKLCQIGALSDSEIVDWLEKHRDRNGSNTRRANYVRTQLRIAFGLDPVSAEKFVILLNGAGSVA